MKPGKVAFLVTGTDTGAGKTYVACLIGRSLRQQGLVVRPLKPVESGCSPGPDGRPHPADAAALRDACAADLPLAAVCLYPLAAPLSPHLAARAEGVVIEPERIVRAVAGAAAGTDVVLVEGAGGIAVEIREGYSFLDLARDAGLRALVVAGNRLGALNHLKLTLRALAEGGVDVAGVVLNDASPDPFPARDPNEAEARRISGERWLGRIPHGAVSLPGETFARLAGAVLRKTPPRA